MTMTADQVQHRGTKDAAVAMASLAASNERTGAIAATLAYCAKKPLEESAAGSVKLARVKAIDKATDVQSEDPRMPLRTGRSNTRKRKPKLRRDVVRVSAHRIRRPRESADRFGAAHRIGHDRSSSHREWSGRPNRRLAPNLQAN